MVANVSFTYFQPPLRQHEYVFTGSLCKKDVKEVNSLDDSLQSVERLFTQINCEYGCSVTCSVDKGDNEQETVELELQLHPLGLLSPLSRIAWEVQKFFLWLIQAVGLPFGSENFQFFHDNPNPHESVDFKGVRDVCYMALTRCVDMASQPLGTALASGNELLQRQLQELEQELGQLQNAYSMPAQPLDVKALQQQINELQRNLRWLESRKSNLTKSINQLEQQKSALEQEVSILKGALGDTAASAEGVALLEKKKADLSSKIDTCNSSIARLRSSKDELDQKLTSLRKELEQTTSEAQQVDLKLQQRFPEEEKKQ